MGKTPQQHSALEHVALQFTRWVGSISSVIVHTIFFIVCFVLGFLGVDWNFILLSLTTLVSLEAIYLAIFIQMSVNENTQSLREVEVDIDEIQEDIDEIQEDVDEIQEDVEDVAVMTEEENEIDLHKQNQELLAKIQNHLQGLMQDVEKLKSK